MVPVIQALELLAFSKHFVGFLVSQLQKRLPSGTMPMQTKSMQCEVHGLSTDGMISCFFKNASSIAEEVPSPVF